MIYKSKKPTKDGRSYQFRIRYKDVYGQTKDYMSRKYLLKKDAERAEFEFKLKLQEHSVVISSKTFEEIYKEWFLEYKKTVKLQTANKQHQYFHILKPIQNIKVNDFNLTKYKTFRSYVDGLGYSVSYEKRIIHLLKHLILYSGKYYNTSTEIIKFIENPHNPNERKKEMQFFTYEEFKKFLSVIPESDFKYYCFFLALYTLGLRQGEGCALQWKDIKNNEVNITKTITTKLKGQIYTISAPKTRNSYRSLPIPLNLQKCLKQLKKAQKTNIGFSNDYFVFGGALPLKESTILARKNKYCSEAGVKQIRIHDFRHSCATYLINHGANIALVSKYLGHASISITLDIYTHLYENELKNVSKMFDNF